MMWGQSRRTHVRGTLTICEVVDEVESWLVVDSGHVRLRDTETDTVGESLSEGTSGDFDAVGVAGFGVSWGQGADLTEVLEIVQRQLEAEEVEEHILEGASDRRDEEKRVFLESFCNLRVTARVRLAVDSREEHRICVPVGKNESITVVPLGVLWVGVEESGRRSGRAKVRGNHQTHLEKRTWAAGAMPIGAPAKKRMSGGAATGTESVRTWMAGVGLADGVGGEGTDGRNSDIVSLVGHERSHGGR